MTARQQQGQKIVVLHTGGLGDLVLASELLAGIKQAQPGAHVTLICKAAIAPVAALYPAPPDEVVPLGFDPLAWSAPTRDLFAALRPVIEDLKTRHAGIFID